MTLLGSHHTRQLVASQSERIPHDLLVHLPLQLEQNLAHRHSAGPMIKASLSFTHTRLVAGGVDTDICRNTHVQAELHTTEALADGILSNLELLGRDATVVVLEADAIVAPDDGGTTN